MSLNPVEAARRDRQERHAYYQSRRTLQKEAEETERAELQKVSEAERLWRHGVTRPRQVIQLHNYA